MERQSTDINGWEATLPLRRAQLVRYCVTLTGDPDAAEDVAQETLYEAWRHLHKVHDPDGFDRWLFAIARNVCRRWAQRRGRELHRRAPSVDDEAAESQLGDILDEATDIEVDLERRELADLLDRALTLLPPQTRSVLIQRYVEESPQTEIALRLGLSEGAVAMRLQRGKLALRHVLTAELRRDAAGHGLIDPLDSAAWQQTRLWCPQCGRHRLDGHLDAAKGELLVRCPGCSVLEGLVINAQIGKSLQGLRSFKPAISRCLNLIHDMFRVRPVDGVAQCPTCHTWLPITRGTPPQRPSDADASESIYLLCPHCGLYDHESWCSLTWSLPEVQQFWRDHPRMSFLPIQEIDAAGSPAVVTTFESLDSAASIEVVTLRDTCRVLRVTANGGVGR